MTPTTDNAAIEFHDSTVHSICAEGANLVIRFAPAYIHRSAGTPGIDPGTGWTQEAIIVLVHAHLSGSPPRLPCVLCDGTVTLGDQSHENCLPAPFVFTGDVVVDLLFEESTAIRATAKELRLDLIGDAVFVEETTE